MFLLLLLLLFFTTTTTTFLLGDVWFGNITRDYNDTLGQPVVQVGYWNARTTLDWIVSQQRNGNLPEIFQSLVVMGCSAGSVGAQVWGNMILESLKWKAATVMPDSYAGVFPPESQGPLIYNYGACTVASSLLSETLVKKCYDQELTLQDMIMEMIPKIPAVPYSFIQSKVDDVQQSFYVAIGVTTNTSAIIDPEQFYSKGKLLSQS